MGSSNHKLFGGAQYYRAMREFAVAVRHMPAEAVTEDEIANAAGMGDRHNGVNFMRAACVIAMEKAQLSFEPMLEALRARTAHIMKRLYPVVEDMIRKSVLAGAGAGGGNNNGGSSAGGASLGAVLGMGDGSSQSKPFQQMMRGIYERFVDAQVDACVVTCRNDLAGMTR